MFEQIDGLLACPDLRCARPAGVRSPYVPLHGVQDSPRYLYYMWNHFYMWISTATDSEPIDR